MLTLYVRHTQLCLNGDGDKIPGLISKGLSPEKLNAWKHCDCPKWYSGMLNGKRHPRTSLKCTSWEAAEVALTKIKAGDNPELGISIEKATKEWLDEVALNGAATSTMQGWNIIRNRLLQFCERQKIRRLPELDAAAINRWRTEWPHEQTHFRPTPGIKPGTAALRISVLKLFFKFARRMRWIKENPMDLVNTKRAKAKKGTDEEERTLPLSPAEYQKLLAGIPVYFAGLRRRIGAMATRPAHFGALIKLMHETGLRVSDATMFRVDQMEVDPSDGWAAYTTRQIKTGTEVTVAIPSWLVSELQSLSPISERYIFFDQRMSLVNFYRAQIWRPLTKAAHKVGIPDMHPHRLRDSFAVNRLNEDMLIQDVSKSLGHASVTMTEKYYAPFVQSRKDALMAKRKAAYVAPATAPGTKVVPISKRRAG